MVFHLMNPSVRNPFFPSSVPAHFCCPTLTKTPPHSLSSSSSYAPQERVKSTQGPLSCRVPSSILTIPGSTSLHCLLSPMSYADPEKCLPGNPERNSLSPPSRVEGGFSSSLTSLSSQYSVSSTTTLTFPPAPANQLSAPNTVIDPLNLREEIGGGTSNHVAYSSGGTSICAQSSIAHLQNPKPGDGAEIRDVHAAGRGAGEGVDGNVGRGGSGGNTPGNGGGDGEGGEEGPPRVLRGGAIPRHVAMILDGNSRWAKRRGLPSEMGHEAGVQSLKGTVKLSVKWGIEALTVFAFSTENWNRPTLEVEFLMALLEKLLDEEIAELNRQDVEVRVIGEIERLPKRLQKKVQEVHELTAGNRGLKLSFAISYSGRQDIVSACRRLAERVEAGELHAADITDARIEAELATSWLGQLSNPDLLIRTSGELRLSNFLLWQCAYTELHFCEALWPEFGEAEYLEALIEFQKRERRYGQRKSKSNGT